MKNEFKFSNSNKRYYTLDYYYKQKYNSKVSKISLNMGLTCPNKDGKVGFGGCIYCSKLGSGDYAGTITKSIKEQFKEIKEVMDRKWPNSKYIAYFQANTNTYGPLDKLKKAWEEALTYENVVGINISTRPDSIDEDCYNYLEGLNKKTDLVVELGLQTIHEKTSKLINRCHSLECFEDAVKELNKRNIKVLVHIINGLPYETKDMMLETIKYLNKLNIWGIKIHMLHIIKNTALEKLYEKEKFHVLSKEEYVDIVCDQLELINENIVINRLTGDPKIEDLIEPTWLIKKVCVLNDIDKELAKRNTVQGIKATF
ncbi:MAG: TIGR01212 family radical SAM protein [Bacilli bacterium]|nr:TIGR01212 family radical SAM protein [Bacilli bacterium]